MASSYVETPAEEAILAILAKARATDIRYCTYYAAGIVGIVAVLALQHWAYKIWISGGANSSLAIQSFTRTARPIRSIIKGPVHGSSHITVGDCFLASSYLAINLSVSLFGIEWKTSLTTAILARRLGWITLCNLSLIVFLGIKNTPLSPLTGRSYRDLNVFHRFCGYITIIWMILHSTIYVSTLSKVHMLELLRMPAQYAGAVAGICFLIIGVTAMRFVRARQYELFFVVHVVLVTAVLISVLLHVKPMGWSSIIVIIVASSVWFADRLFRSIRWIYYARRNYCTLVPLPNRATRVIMERSITAMPGSHAIVWIPAVRRLQCHPFTILANSPTEFVVSAKNGFTEALYKTALSNPNGKYRTAVEGPYGHVPSIENFDKAILIGGGSGATFVLAMARSWVEKNTPPIPGRILHVVWIIRSKECLQWFENELDELLSAPSVELKIFITRPDIAGVVDGLAPAAYSADIDPEKLYNGIDKEVLPSVSAMSMSLHRGRPNLVNILRDGLRDAQKEGKVLVAVSGPSGLLNLRYIMGITVHLKNIAIVGAGGTLGRFITEALLNTGIHNVTAITRFSSTTEIPNGAAIERVDFDRHETLVRALRGQDALVITLNGHAVAQGLEQKLIEAAVEAGVSWILPNEWSPDSSNEEIVRDMPGFAAKGATRKLIEDIGKSSYIAIVTGFWYEYSLAMPMNHGFNFENRTAIFFDEGDAKMSTSTWSQIGRAVAALLSLSSQKNSDGGTYLDHYRNKVVYVNSFTISQHDMLQSILRVTNAEMKDWTVRKVSARERFAEGLEEISHGKKEGFPKLASRIFFDDGCGNFETSKGTLNAVLGLPEEDLDEATRRAIERQRHSQ